eukprot:1154429-Amphidinium_carterae.1
MLLRMSRIGMREPRREQVLKHHKTVRSSRHLQSLCSKRASKIHSLRAAKSTDEHKLLNEPLQRTELLKWLKCLVSKRTACVKEEAVEPDAKKRRLGEGDAEFVPPPELEVHCHPQ